MARAKNGTRMAYVSMMSEEKESTWITGHYNGFIDTVTETDTLSAETGTVLQTETAINIEINSSPADSEVFSISFVADDRPTPIQTVGEFKAV
jgi:hypothetical protein